MKTVNEFYVFLMRFIFCLKKKFSCCSMLFYWIISFTTEWWSGGTILVTPSKNWIKAFLYLIRKKLPLFQVIYCWPTRKKSYLTDSQNSRCLLKIGHLQACKASGFFFWLIFLVSCLLSTTALGFLIDEH